MDLYGFRDKVLVFSSVIHCQRSTPIKDNQRLLRYQILSHCYTLRIKHWNWTSQFYRGVFHIFCHWKMRLFMAKLDFWQALRKQVICLNSLTLHACPALVGLARSMEFSWFFMAIFFGILTLKLIPIFPIFPLHTSSQKTKKDPKSQKTTDFPGRLPGPFGNKTENNIFPTQAGSDWLSWQALTEIPRDTFCEGLQDDHSQSHQEHTIPRISI